jgi:hypothetical protein
MDYEGRFLLQHDAKVALDYYLPRLIEYIESLEHAKKFWQEECLKSDGL